MATWAATPSATSRGGFRCRCRRCVGLGLGRVAALGDPPPPPSPAAAVGSMAEASPGKDSVTGHWEMMGIVLSRPFPVFRMDSRRRSSRSSRAGPAAASLATRRPRAPGFSTSSGRSTCGPARSSSTPRPTACFKLPRMKTWCRSPELYRACEVAYELVVEGLGVGRVIARPFVGVPGQLQANGQPARLRAAALGRHAARSGQGGESAGGRDRQDRGSVRRPRHHPRDPHRQRRRRNGPARAADGGRGSAGLIFVNLVDFDTRVRPSQRCRRLRRQSGAVRSPSRPSLAALAPDDVLIVTADHGNDPTTPSTDHAREYVPLLVAGSQVRAGADLGTRAHVRRPGPDPRRHLRRRAARPRHELPAGDHGMSFARSWRRGSVRSSRLQAAKSADSRGRLREEAEDEVRPAFQRDRDRIIHCKAFRRLKHKTQVFFAPTGDHYRTRLTHTLEVSQIARTIAKVLRLHEELTEAIALGHDLGSHPVRPCRRAGHRQPHARRLQPLRAEPARRRSAGERRPRIEPDVGSARRHREAFEREVGGAGRR